MIFALNCIIIIPLTDRTEKFLTPTNLTHHTTKYLFYFYKNKKNMSIPIQFFVNYTDTVHSYKQKIVDFFSHVIFLHI